METVSNLCANKKASHNYHARGTWCAHGGALWGMNHIGGHKKKDLLALDEKGRRTLCARLCEVLENEIHL
jgi:hypothetical protein